MAVEFNRRGSKMTYRLVAEEASQADIKEALENVKDAKAYKNGMSKDGNMRLSFEIPRAVLYNYLVINGIKPHEHNSWLKDRKNLKRLKAEFPMFCV
jgi:hypothetical protein